MLFDLNPKDSVRSLYGRENELKEVTRLTASGRWVAILGPRMVGKTSLIKVAAKELEKHTTVYVNLWGIRSAHGLLSSLVNGLNSSRGLVQRIRDGAQHVKGLSIGPSGISLATTEKPLRTISELLDTLGRYRGGIVIALDEVQELSPFSAQLLKLLANIFNTHPKMVFIFTGSMFGLMKTLLEPSSTSPLYGRAPAKLYLKPFERDTSLRFLRKGFEEYHRKVSEVHLEEAVERLDGLSGWLALYGNNVAVSGMSQKKALEETFVEGSKVTKDELEHFLLGRARESHIAALKASAISSRWSEIKEAIQTARGTPVNDATVRNVVNELQASMLITEESGVYRVVDPMLRSVLLSSGFAKL